jgi:hypothetical protein
VKVSLSSSIDDVNVDIQQLSNNPHPIEVIIVPKNINLNDDFIYVTGIKYIYNGNNNNIK